MKQAVPQKKEKANNSKFKKVWYNYKCYNARELSFKYLKEFRKSNNITNKQIYLRANQKYKSLCEDARREYNEKLFAKIDRTSSSKEWWSLAREIRGDSFQVGAEISAAEFKIYFQAMLNPLQLTNDIQYAAAWYQDDYLDKEITIMEVEEVVRNTKTNKAPGQDRVTYELLKNATKEFLQELTKVYNVIVEKGKIDETILNTIIFPILKKGDPNLASNYRGISFMNCTAKVLMGIINKRLSNWVEEYNILTEFQAGFRKNFSTVDNIYNLASIVHSKFNENKKVYAYFVDFKAAFDRVPRKPLLYKLRQIGISTKIVNFIENIYQNTKMAVWTGQEVSDYFETGSGVKQGCLLSPLLFTLYLNDLHEYLGNGLMVENINIRLLLYADDIVLLADNPRTMQAMIHRLEKYCSEWSMEVNPSKSEIMIFRKGGRISQLEKWWYNGEDVRVVAEYRYLGVILTPKMTFGKHLEARNNAATASINCTWKDFLAKSSVSLKNKWKLFQAVCRSVQSYAAQVWGYTLSDEVDKLQRYFIKRILRIPDFTPNYAIFLETGAEESHFFALGLHMKYIFKTLYEYKESRLPHKLSRYVIQKNIFWYKHLNEMGSEFGLIFDKHINSTQWHSLCIQLLIELKAKHTREHSEKALASASRIYKYLDQTKGSTYIKEGMRIEDISMIFKARCDLLRLNANNFGNVAKMCSLCNLNEEENVKHFIGRCPVLAEFRNIYLKKVELTEKEIISALNGENDENWRKMLGFLYSALRYRNYLIAEFN